jgi:hypothetical protein
MGNDKSNLISEMIGLLERNMDPIPLSVGRDEKQGSVGYGSDNAEE